MRVSAGLRQVKLSRQHYEVMVIGKVMVSIYIAIREGPNFKL